MIVADRNLLILLQRAALYPANGNTAHKLVVVNGRHQHLEGLIQIGLRGRDIVQNGIKQWLEVGAGHIGRIGRNALPGRTEQHGRVQLLVCGIQIQQKLQHLVYHLMDALIGTVNLIDDHNDAVAQLQRAAQHKAGLGHGTFRCIHQQNDAVDHFQDTLHLTAKVGVARRIHDIDLGISVLDGGVFGKNGDAALALQIIGVHHAVHCLLIFPVYAALLEHLVHQRGFAVVNMGDDGYISQLLVFQM